MVWKTAKKVEGIRHTMQANMDAIVYWSNKWESKISKENTVCMIFSRSSKSELNICGGKIKTRRLDFCLISTLHSSKVHFDSITESVIKRLD